MAENVLIDKKVIECPICGKKHVVEEKERQATVIIKGEEVAYLERFFYCENADEDECDFVTAPMMDANLLNARNAYRMKHGLLTSDEIVALRVLYGLSQVDLEALELLESNKDSFSEEKYESIKAKMKDQLQSYGKEFLSQQALKGVYADYMEPSVWNGNAVLNIPKIEAIISYFADAVVNPLKTKMMKMLWYADALSYKKRGIAMTGLVYAHDHYGALPLGHNVLVNLENLNVEEKYSSNYDVILRFYPSDKADYSVLDKEEVKILKETAGKFKTYSAKEIVDYMHEENAYTKTKQGDLISFDLAKEIRQF